MTDSPFPPERTQHDRITRDSQQIADAAGGIGQPYRVEGLLGRLERHGDISRAQRLAGERFGELFRMAAMDPLKATDMGQRFDRAAYGAHPSEWARARVNAALDACGGLHSPAGSIAWFVLGLDLSIRAWSMREAFGHNRPVSPHVAKGCLCACLGVLVKHFGM